KGQAAIGQSLSPRFLMNLGCQKRVRMFRRTTFAALAVATLAVGGLSACSPITSYSGFQAIDSDPKDVKVGTDTKSTVRAKLGSPSVTSTFDPNVWFYMNLVKQRVAFQKPHVVTRNI